MDVLPAERQHVELCVGELRASAAMLGNEDVAAALVVKDPADVTAREVIEVEVPLVGEAPDPLARVVQRSRAALPGAPTGIDLLTGCRRPGLGGGRQVRLAAGAGRGERQHGEEKAGLDGSHRIAQYGSEPVVRPEAERPSR
jgi:hypothetical protein